MSDHGSRNIMSLVILLSLRSELGTLDKGAAAWEGVCSVLVNIIFQSLL